MAGELKQKKIHKVIQPKGKHWVGNGFHVSTVFSIQSEDYYYLTPFLLLDHASPQEFSPTDSKRGVGEHPHRGFETVTFAIQGSVDHQDSGGGGGTIHTGGVQWMTAGSGVVHEEFHGKEFAADGGVFEMVQLWVNLRAKDKMSQPRYQSMNKEDFPLVDEGGGAIQVKVIAGKFKGSQGPAKTFTDINIYEIQSKKNKDLQLEFNDQTNTLIIQLKGSSTSQGEQIEQGEVVLFERDGKKVEMKLSEKSHILVLNGEPIDEPVASYGPFVMNSKAEIREAIQDFEAGKMGQLVKESNEKKGS